ncbi:MAG: YigZ family protein [Lachnospiraceae bacterium]|nr:YigZ family protein [Lachnospiraceae bacterium]
MDKQYKTVYEGGEGEIIEKKSRFIATVIPCEEEETALAFIEATKKKYWDARHNCSAYTIGLNHELERCSDDGEPQKTAGRPMLDVLLNEGIHNVCVVVTRYFGGVLLGTGGLVRAYQAATKEGLANSTIITKQFGKKIKIVTDYNGIGKLQYIVATSGYTMLSADYTDVVTARVMVTPSEQESFIKKVTEATSGKAEIEEEGELWFADNEGEVLLFED